MYVIVCFPSSCHTYILYLYTSLSLSLPTSLYLSLPLLTSPYLSLPLPTSPYVSLRLRMSTYLSYTLLLVQDPIPYIMQGNADFVTSVETRGCPARYSNSNSSHSNSNSGLNSNKNVMRVEGNTGVFYVRATEKGVDFFEKCLENLVDMNVRIEQKALGWISLGATYTGNCNLNLDGSEGLSSFSPSSSSSSPPSQIQTTNSNSNSNLPGTNGVARFCLLDEILFQNGKF